MVPSNVPSIYKSSLPESSPLITTDLPMWAKSPVFGRSIVPFSFGTHNRRIQAGITDSKSFEAFWGTKRCIRQKKNSLAAEWKTASIAVYPAVYNAVRSRIQGRKSGFTERVVHE